MIIVEIKGGLGNQMFQYALGRILSIKNNDVLKLDTSAYSVKFNRPDQERKFDLQHFNIKAEAASEEEINILKNKYGIFSKGWRFLKNRVLKIHNIDYYPRLLNKTGDFYLSGFFQSELYFKGFEDVIAEDFSIKKYSTQGEELIEKIKETTLESQTISIHIRRGDVVIDAKTNKYYGICDIPYYEKSIREIIKRLSKDGTPVNPTFFIFSDDIDWVRQNLKINFPTFFVSGRNIPDYEEIMIMSLCQHNIIANSSYSWWAAWLNKNENKIIIAPKVWIKKFPNPHKNILPKSWIQI